MFLAWVDLVATFQMIPKPQRSNWGWGRMLQSVLSTLSFFGPAGRWWLAAPDSEAERVQTWIWDHYCSDGG